MPRGNVAEVDRERVLELYDNQKMTVAAVQATTGYGRAAILAVLRDAQVTRHVKHLEPQQQDDERYSWRAIARDHHRDGTPIPVLARRYNVGEDYVRFCLRRAGFPERTESGPAGS